MRRVCANPKITQNTKLSFKNRQYNSTQQVRYLSHRQHTLGAKGQYSTVPTDSSVGYLRYDLPTVLVCFSLVRARERRELECNSQQTPGCLYSNFYQASARNHSATVVLVGHLPSHARHHPVDINSLLLCHSSSSSSSRRRSSISNSGSDQDLRSSQGWPMPLLLAVMRQE